ncbi:unnamed protein product [Calypogeia fissa]
MAMRYLRRALLYTSVSWRSSHVAAALSGSEVLRLATCAPQSLPAAPYPALQGFARDFSSASPAYTPIEANNVYEYNKLIQAINLKRRPSLVRDVYEDMLLDGVQPIQETFFLLIDGCMQGSRLQDVMYFFEEMKAMGLTPDVTLYNCVIAACGRSMQVDRAFQVAEEMEASGIQPKHRTFLALLRTCAIAGRVDQAYGVVTRMTASGLSLDKNFYCALITAHEKQKPRTEDAVQKIFELLEQSKQHSAEDVMAVAATGELETTDDMDDGLASMLSDDRQPRRGSLNRRLAVYHAAVKSLYTLGNKEAVKTVLKLVEEDGHQLDSYCVTQLIRFHLMESDFEQACAEYSRFVDTGRQPALELYMVLIEGAIDHSTPESSAIAQKLLADFVQKKYFLNAQLGSKLLQRVCHSKSKDVVVASMVWDIMRSREVKISKFIAGEYYRVLERSGTPKDDPRFIEVKALADIGRKGDSKGRAEATQTSLPDEVPGPGAVSEQASGPTTPLEMPSNEFYSEAKSEVLLDDQPPIEPPSRPELLNSSSENVESNEKI